MDLNAEDLPGCCGVLVLFDFPYDERNSKKEIVDALIYFKRQAEEDNYAMIQATTIPSQRVARAALRKVGFKIVEQCHRSTDKANKIAVHILTLGSKR